MDINRFLSGTQVELEQMLAAREQRVRYQERILKDFPMTLISFSLNIAGPIKVFPLARKAFEEGIELIRCQCRVEGIATVHAEQIDEVTGLEAYFSADAPPQKVKRAMVAVEKRTSLGRLFDIDVLDSCGNKLSRTELGEEERRCLVCGKPAFLCSRARAHSLEEIQRCICSIMWDYFARQYAVKVASAASRALLYEVLATPKPGLVDKNNSGAHRDMDIVTFETSALALIPYFQAFVTYGTDHCGEPPETMLPKLRELGLQAEVDMMRATGGVNTHRGIIFSLGFILCALGIWHGRGQRPTRSELRETCLRLAAPLAGEPRAVLNQSAASHGEQLYIKYGVKGARGEAIAGFPALFETALPAMDSLLFSGASLNDAGVVTLLHIISSVEDSNLIYRSSPERAGEIRKQLCSLLCSGLPLAELVLAAGELDKQFIAENLSPGGSADLLALCYLIRFLEQDGLMAAPDSTENDRKETDGEPFCGKQP